mgnify:CR=1 FL=1
MNDNTAISFDAHFDRTLVRADGRSVRYLVVDVEAPALPEQNTQEQPPLNLGLVLDASGSMDARDGGATENALEHHFGMSRLEAAQAASAGVAECLSGDDRLSVVSFADEAITHLAGETLDGPGHALARQAIETIRTRGCTDLRGGWLEGAEQVAALMQESPNSRHRLLLLSDGHANRGITDPEFLASEADALRRRGITTSTVGIGADYSTEQIEALAAHGGGMMHHTASPSEIVEVVLAELRQIKATVVEDLELEVSYDNGTSGAGGGGATVDIEAMGLASEQRGGTTSAVVGPLTGGAARRVVFRIWVTTSDHTVDLNFRVGARWRAAGHDAHRTCETMTSLQVADKHDVYGEILDADVGESVARIWSAEIVTRAMVLNREGDYRKARHYVRDQLRHFERYCRRFGGGEDLIDGLHKTMRRIVRPMREHSRKEIMTHSHKSARGARDLRAAMADESYEKYLDE